MLLLRRAEAHDGDHWWTVLRVVNEHTGAIGPSAVSLSSALNLSHNAAFACSADGESVLAFGGRRKDLASHRAQAHEPGIHVAVGDETATPTRAPYENEA